METQQPEAVPPLDLGGEGQPRGQLAHEKKEIHQEMIRAKLVDAKIATHENKVLA